jgi:sugar lactone lactonase YvrE
VRREVKHQFYTFFLGVTAFTFLTGNFANADNIYVSCLGTSTIQKYDASGNMTTFASDVNSPKGLAFDSSNNLYVASYNNSAIYKFDPSGNRSTFASGLYNPVDLAFDSSDNLYVSSYSYSAIFKFNPGGNRTTFASGLSWPQGLSFDSSGNLYVGVYGIIALPFIGYEGSISKYDPNGQWSTYIDWQVQLGIPMDLVFDSSSYLYISDPQFSSISKWDSSQKRTTVASGLNKPAGLAFDSNGNLYAAIEGSGMIMKFDSDGKSSIFASGLNQPTYIAIQVPEPATLFLLGLGTVILRKRKNKHLFSNS